MCRFETDQEMHMIFRTSYALRRPLKTVGYATQVFVKAFTPSRVNQRLSVFGGEHDMVMKAEEC